MKERKSEYEWSEWAGRQASAGKINLGNAMRTFDKKREEEEQAETPQ